MWSKTFKPGDGKVKRDVAMSAQVVFGGKEKNSFEHFAPGPTDPEEKGRDRGEDGRGGGKAGGGVEACQREETHYFEHWQTLVRISRC